MKRENEDKCLEDEVKDRKTDSEGRTEIDKLMSGEPIGRLQGMDKAKRNEILRNQENRRRIAKTDYPSYLDECRYCLQCLVLANKKNVPLLAPVKQPFLNRSALHLLHSCTAHPP